MRELRVTSSTHFYPRSPCGERPTKFNSFHENPRISIHALLAESDLLQNFLLVQGHNFYPRSPCGERQEILKQLASI